MTRRSSYTTVIASIFMMLMSLLGTIRAANAGTWSIDGQSLRTTIITMNGSTTTDSNYYYSTTGLTQDYPELTSTMDVRNNYTRRVKNHIIFDWHPTGGDAPSLTPGFYGDRIDSTFSISSSFQCGTPKVTDVISVVTVFKDSNGNYTAQYDTDTTFSVTPYNPLYTYWYFGGHEISTLTYPT